MDHALVLIGASAGGVEAVRDVVTALPADLDASVGTTVAQDPDTARFPSMPSSAIISDHVDQVAAPYAIAEVIPEFASTTRRSPAPATSGGVTIHLEEPDGPPAPFTCPRCHGPLCETEHGDVLRYRCRVGHAWSEQAMHDSQAEDVEEALWTAVRTLREKAAMADRLAERAADRGLTGAARHHRQQATELRDNAETIRGALGTLSGSSVTQEHAR